MFLYRSYKINDWKWSKQPWFVFAILLWITGLIICNSRANARLFFWSRVCLDKIPLYAVAIQMWLGQNKDIRVLMLTIMTISLLIISFILFAEVLLEPKK